MSYMDIVECDAYAENEGEIRILINSWKDAKKKAENSSLYTTSSPKPLQDKRLKVVSLLHVLTCLQKSNRNVCLRLLTKDFEAIDSYITQNLKNMGGRYMVDSTMAVTNAITEAMAQSIIKNESQQQELDAILQEECPQFFPKNKTGEELADALIEFIEKTIRNSERSKRIPKIEGMAGFEIGEMQYACLKYVFAWKLQECQNDATDVLRYFFEIAGHEEQYMFNERMTETYIDWLLEMLDIAPPNLEDDKLFLKYRNRCMKEAAEWLDAEVQEPDKKVSCNTEGEEEMEVEYPCLYDYEADYREYIHDIFDYWICMLQRPSSAVGEVTAECFGRSPLSYTLNTLAENKWYIKDIGDDNREAAFRIAEVSIISTNAFVNFEGDLCELEKSTIMRRSRIKNMETFVVSLFNAYVINLISYEYKRKDYQLYKEKKAALIGIHEDAENLSRKWKNNIEKHVGKVNEEQEKLLTQKDEEISRLLRKIEALEKAQENNGKEKNGESSALAEEARLLAKENRKLKERLEQSEEKIKTQREMIDAYEQALDSKENEDEEPMLSDEELLLQRILFVGGRYELIRKLKDTMPNAKFVQFETDPVPDLSKIERIIYFSNFINHCTYNKIFDTAKGYDIPFSFIHTQNYEQVTKVLKHWKQSEKS